MHTINVNVVRGHLIKFYQHENLSYESFMTQKFPVGNIHIVVLMQRGLSSL